MKEQTFDSIGDHAIACGIFRISRILESLDLGLNAFRVFRAWGLRGGSLEFRVRRFRV